MNVTSHRQTGFCGASSSAGRRYLFARRRGARVASRSASAFTIIELLVVISLLVLLASMAWPNLSQRIVASELPESAARFRDTLFLLRAEAVLEHRRFRIRFEPEVQQPIIEYEPDRLLYPGEWEPVTAAWARELMDGDSNRGLLLGDVQVNEIRPRRPIYLEPLREGEDPATLIDEREEELELEAERVAEGFDTGTAMGAAAKDDDYEIDENRPIIMFEADGSTEWATIILSRVSLDEDLTEENKQIWIILDGRTGLASIRGQVTEEELNDRETYVEREKLEPLDEVNINSLSYSVSSGDDAAATGDGSSENADGDGGGESAQDGGNSDVEDLAGDIADELAGNEAEGEERGGGGREPIEADDGGDRPRRNRGELDRDLDGADDLTAEERRNIRRGLRNRSDR